MITERQPTVHLALFEGLIDSEIGHLLVELRSGRFTGATFHIVTVAAGSEPVTTMAGLRVTPDVLLSGLDPHDSDLLVMAGGTMWDAGGGQEFAAAASRFLGTGVPVAAICGATAGLARAGLLDDRQHTSSAPEYLAATGYAGGHLYLDRRAVVDGGLITAGPQSPVQFARAVLGHLGLMADGALQAYEDLFHDGNRSAFPRLVRS